jgi:hypothetical protein
VVVVVVVHKYPTQIMVAVAVVEQAVKVAALIHLQQLVTLLIKAEMVHKAVLAELVWELAAMLPMVAMAA